MNEKDRYKEVANAVRVEYNEQNNDLFLVFKVTDKWLRKRIIENWMDDIDLKLINKRLYTFQEDENE